MNDEELLNVVGDEIRNILQSNIGRVSSPDSCSIIQANIVSYLQEINNRMGYYNIPEVRVENEGPFVTVNFFNSEGDRLETLGDMLEYMSVVL